jgi:hypothetical protein
MLLRSGLMRLTYEIQRLEIWCANSHQACEQLKKEGYENLGAIG